MEIQKWIITLSILVYPWAVYKWGIVFWAMVKNKPTVYKQEDVVDGLVMRHGPMQKKTLESINSEEFPQITISKFE